MFTRVRIVLCMDRTNYIICDGHSNAIADGIQSRIVADRAAQAHADRIGQTVYLSGPDCDDEPVEPSDLTVRMTSAAAQRSTCTTIADAVDYDVTIAIPGREEIVVGITLAPQPVDGGRLGPIGDTLDAWLTVQRGAAAWADLGDEAERAIVQELASWAAAITVAVFTPVSVSIQTEDGTTMRGRPLMIVMIRALVGVAWPLTVPAMAVAWLRRRGWRS